VVPSQKFVNNIIRNSRIIQLYEVSQILLASSSGLMGVSCLQDPLFDRCVISHALLTYEFLQNSENLKSSKIWRFPKFPLNRNDIFINSN